MCSQEPPKDLISNYIKFRCYVEGLPKWKLEVLLQNLSNELMGVKAEYTRMRNLEASLLSRIKTIHTVYAGDNIQGVTCGDFIRYRLSTLLSKQVFPTDSRKELNWGILDRYGYVAREFYFIFAGGSRTVLRLRKRNDLKFAWSKRKLIKTRDPFTITILLCEEQKRAPLIHVQAEFPKRRIQYRSMETTDFKHYYLVRFIDGSKPQKLPFIIKEWTKYK